MSQQRLSCIEALRAQVVACLKESARSTTEDALNSLVTVIYLATAKSDNAVKCQFPIWYRKNIREEYPRIRGRSKLVWTSVPPVIKSTDIVRLCTQLSTIDRVHAAKLMDNYISFLLASDADYNQLTALLDGFIAAEGHRATSGAQLIAPLVAFQIRGSVAASGGHDPEQVVRRYLAEWGLEPTRHFNLIDVTAGNLSDWLVAEGDTNNGERKLQKLSKDKTRAFDFIIPCYQTEVDKRVFIQAQFYAGDSGSVSHKNVDQAGKAREAAAVLFPDARFVELVDGAGYCASLRNDLRHLLFAADTDDFVQVRSIAIRLRRILQESGIVTPLDVAVRVHEGLSNVSQFKEEMAPKLGGTGHVDSLIAKLIAEDWILLVNPESISVHPSRQQIVGRYAILDSIANEGTTVTPEGDGIEYVLIPGYGPNFGLPTRACWDRSLLHDLVGAGVLELVGSER